MDNTKLKQQIKWILSPTLFVSDCYKSNASSTKDRGRRVIKLNKMYFIIGLIITATGVMINTIQTSGGLKYLMLVSYPIYCLSRCNEIFMAFVKDVFDKLNTEKRDKNGLEYFERIRLALRSYVELVLHYALLYYLVDFNYIFYGLGGHAFERPLEGLFDAIYFSVITIVSVGYGEIHPIHNISKALVMYEVINGMLLLVVSFTVYVNLTLDE